MADTTDACQTRTGPVVSGCCRLEEHRLCQAGPVVTRYGDVALTVRCDCGCHRKGRR